MATWLAFFALACQLSLSFGHVHISNPVVNNRIVNGSVIGNSGAGSTTRLEVAEVDATEVDATNLEVSGRTAVPAAPMDPVGTAGDLCAICTNISLLGALILPILALILAPASLTRVLRWPVVAATSASLRQRSFGARGPPTSAVPA